MIGRPAGAAVAMRQKQQSAPEPGAYLKSGAGLSWCPGPVIVSESMNWPSSFLIRSSPPPRLVMISRARLFASSLVAKCWLARSWPSLMTSQPPRSLASEPRSKGRDCAPVFLVERAS